MEQQYFGVGRRKTSIARVILSKGEGSIVVNGKKFLDYFKKTDFLSVLQQPLSLTSNLKKFDIKANVCGGGMTGQLEAIQLGIVRALIKSDETLAPLLRQNGLLTRDPRMKERKKYGQRGARARFQFSKR